MGKCPLDSLDPSAFPSPKDDLLHHNMAATSKTGRLHLAERILSAAQGGGGPSAGSFLKLCCASSGISL